MRPFWEAIQAGEGEGSDACACSKLAPCRMLIVSAENLSGHE